MREFIEITSFSNFLEHLKKVGTFQSVINDITGFSTAVVEASVRDSQRVFDQLPSPEEFVTIHKLIPMKFELRKNPTNNRYGYQYVVVVNIRGEYRLNAHCWLEAKVDKITDMHLEDEVFNWKPE